MTPIKILIADDKPAIYEAVKDTAEDRGLDNFTFLYCSNISEATAKFKEVDADILVLDMKNDTSGEYDGKSILQEILDDRFMPTVIYSAFDKEEATENFPEDLPLLSYIKKGSGKEADLIDELIKYQDFVLGVRTVEDQLAEIKSNFLKEYIKKISKPIESVENKKTIIERGFFRRLAAQIDLNLFDKNSILHPFEMYIIPPFEDEDLFMGDILMKKNVPLVEELDPKHYLLVLTPSCDLAYYENKDQKRKAVMLTAVRLLKPTEEFFKDLKITTSPLGEFRKAIREKLNSPQFSGKIILPEFPGVIPSMVANLKDLTSVDFSKIDVNGNTEGEYKRVASVDSPFREYLAWGFVQDFGRPAVPVRDTKEWANNIHSKF